MSVIDNDLLAAARKQLALDIKHEGWRWRWASLKEGFRGPVTALDYGTGYYTIEEASGEVCEFDGVWLLDGQVLLCRKCYEDGT